MNERDIFIAALEKQTDAERVAMVDEACGGDGELRAGVEALLREHARLDSFLESPAPLFVDCGDEDGGGQPQDDGPRIAVPGLETGVLGDFRILREIGHGGMGVVYEAEQISLGRRLALKVLPFAAMLDPRQLQRFQNEARAAASLKHPNIVQVYAVGCERGVHYFAMEYVEGRTLSEVLRGWQQEAGLRPQREKEPAVGPDEEAHQQETAGSPTALSTKDTRRGIEAFRTIALWGVQAAEALEHAHQMGVVHRDIKSANLMVDARGHLWITDFGLAMTRKDPAVTKTGDVIGTLRYMSPEQALGKGHALDHRADIYSLGVTLYELLTLQPAFPENDCEQLVRRLLSADPPTPRSLSRAIPKDLETIVLKAMTKEPAQRYATAQQLADDLKRFLADEPIQARRPSLADRTARWTRRHRPVVWAGVASLLVAVAALAISTVLIAGAYQREKDQRAQAEAAAVREKEAAEHEKQQRAAAVAAAAKAEENAARAAKNLEVAREAVRQMLTRVADEELAKIPKIKEVRQRLVEDAAGLYLQRAMENAQKATEGSLEKVVLYKAVAGIYRELGDYQKVVDASTKAIDLCREMHDESSPLVKFYCYVDRGDGYSGLKMYAAALADYDKAVTLEPFRWYTYKRRALTHFYLQDYDKALADIAKAVELKPDDTSNLRWIPIGVEAKCPNEGFRQGLLGLIDKTIEKVGTQGELSEFRAILLATLGRRQEALAALAKARELNPDLAWLKGPIAEIYVHHYALFAPDARRLGEAVLYLRDRAQANDTLSPSLIRWASQWVPAAMRGTDNLPAMVFVSDLPWVRSSCGWGPSAAVRNVTYWGRTILIDLLPYDVGIHTHALEDARPADVVLDVTGQKFSAFKAQVGVRHAKGSVQYQVLVDGNIRCETPVLRAGNLSSIEADVAGGKEIVLRVLNGGDGNASDSAAWGLARLLRTGATDPLEEAPAELRSAAEANAAFFLAEVHWRLDQKELARRWYDKGAEWMDKNKTKDEKVRGYREEAAKLLGIGEKPATSKEQGDKR